MLLNHDDRTCSVAPYERQAWGATAMMGEAQEGGDELVAALVGRVLSEVVREVARGLLEPR
jgi:hypothetical protein